jgi:UDP:flavonoid glycosyltransferase YjiC (YdhE family)
MRRILLLPLGSSGDVHPFLWIGRLLRARGHDVGMIASPVFGEAIRALDLRHIPFGTEADYHALLGDPDMWHPTRGQALVMRAIGESATLHYELLAREANRDTLVIAPGTAFGARVARQKLHFPLVTIHLQPCVLLSVGDTPFFARGLGWMRNLAAPIKRVLFRLIEARIGGLVSPGVRAACSAAGVPAPRNAFRDWWNSPDGGVCLWPEWFGAPQREWPRNLRCAGFPLYDLADHVPLAPALEDFLAAGPPPVLFTAGTAMAQAREFFATAREACHATGRRAILATKFPSQLPAALPPEVFHANYAPFSLLLPRCAGIVHHGGIGTTSQALAAGAPQIIQPFSHDQPDNAARVRRLGCGDLIWPGEFTPKNLARKLDAVLDDPAVRARCADVAERLRAEDAAARLLDALTPWLAI